jgi:GT2 family glycosyltransferase
MINYDIIIPVWNQADLTVALLQSIKKQSKDDYRIILIDNNSDVDEFKKVNKELQNHKYRVLRNCQNLGFVKAVNQGLALSTAKYIVIQNNDTEIITNKWLYKLENAFQINRVGISAPITNNKNQWQGREQLSEGQPVLLPTGRMVAFFSVMISRECFEKVGYLDECFGVGFGDDDDYCMRSQKSGFQIALNRNVMVNHYHRTTFKSIYTVDEIKDMQTKALKTYKNKHDLK